MTTTDIKITGGDVGISLFDSAGATLRSSVVTGAGIQVQVAGPCVCDPRGKHRRRRACAGHIVAARHQHRAMDGVLQLAHVALPAIGG